MNDREAAPGRRMWLWAGGRVPLGSTGREPEFTSHDAVAVLNAGDGEVEVAVTLVHADRDPVGPYTITVPARRVRRFRVNDLIDPRAVPLESDYAIRLEASAPVIVQCTRQDTRQGTLAVLGTLAHPLGEEDLTRARTGARS